MTTLAPTVSRSSTARGTMRAAVLTAPGSVEVREMPVPEPGPGQVRIRLESCGVCGSNIPVWEGREWFKYPLEPGKPGHEGCGVVDAVGLGVGGLHVGQRVGALTYSAFAEYDLADARNVVPIPPSLAGRPCPAEALGCAMNVFARSGIRAGDHVAVVGIGFLGALVAQLALRAGAKVTAISRRDSALRTARDMGIRDTLPLDDHSRVIEAIKSRTDGKLCDVVVEAAGTQGVLDLCTELTRERGRLVIAGFHQDGARSVNMFLWNWRGLDVINAHERDPAVYIEGMRRAVRAIAEGRLDPAPLYTHEYPLERLGEALEAARTRPDGFMKAIVRM